MATMSVHIKVNSRVPQLTRAMKQKAGTYVAKAAADIEAQAKARAPVDTGLLKNSIVSRQEDDLRHIVEAPLHYSVYQEFGTRKMPAQPYMLPAVEFVKPSFEIAMRSLVP